MDMNWWATLSAGQGSALSGAFTATGAVVGVFIASRFFSGKVKTLSEALSESKRLLDEHALYVNLTLTDITEKFNVLDTQFSSFTSGIGRIESSVGDLSDKADESTDEALTADWDTIRGLWLDVRDELEKRASSDLIDGRTRAKYGRIDRRKYIELIDSMASDRKITDADAESFRSAFSTWRQYKNGRKVVEQKDVKKLRELKEKLNIERVKV